MIQNLVAFIIAATLEILGCFAFWLWLRRGSSPAIAALGILCLIGFAVALTRVDAAFAGRAYAAYGGIYIAASLVWLWLAEGQKPTASDMVGAGLAIIGALVIVGLAARTWSCGHEMTDRAVSLLDASRRPLTKPERRLIRSKIRSLTARGRRASRAALPISGGVVLLLWLWTVLATDASWLIVTLFWLVVGGAIALWVRRDMDVHAGQFGIMAHDLQSALRRNAADVYDIRARSFAVFEEIEDEGACYAFELEGDRLVWFDVLDKEGAVRFFSGKTWADVLAHLRGLRDEPVFGGAYFHEEWSVLSPQALAYYARAYLEFLRETVGTAQENEEFVFYFLGALYQVFYMHK